MPVFLRVLVIMLIAAAIFAACKKGNETHEITRRDDLLGSWSRNLRAYDYNGNHILNSSEIKYAPATDTFLFNLAPDATYQRIQTFKGQDFPVYGTWHLQNNDSDIVMQATTSTIAVDTFRFDTVSQFYIQYHTISSQNIWYWEGFVRPR